MKKSENIKQLLTRINLAATKFNRNYSDLNSKINSFLLDINGTLIVEGLYPKGIRFYCGDFDLRLFNCLNQISFDFGSRRNRQQALVVLSAVAFDELRIMAHEVKWSDSLVETTSWFDKFNLSYKEVILEFAHKNIQIYQDNKGDIKISIHSNYLASRSLTPTKKYISNISYKTP